MKLREVLNSDDLKLNRESLDNLANEYPILISLQRLDYEIYIKNLRLRLDCDSYSEYQKQRIKEEIIKYETKIKNRILDYTFLQNCLDSFQYPISEIGHALCDYKEAEKLYNEHEEIEEYFKNLCNECKTSGTDFIKMNVIEILDSPEIAKYRIIEGYLQSFAGEVMDYEVGKYDLETCEVVNCEIV